MFCSMYMMYPCLPVSNAGFHPKYVARSHRRKSNKCQRRIPPVRVIVFNRGDIFGNWGLFWQIPLAEAQGQRLRSLHVGSAMLLVCRMPSIHSTLACNFKVVSLHFSEHMRRCNVVLLLLWNSTGSYRV